MTKRPSVMSLDDLMGAKAEPQAETPQPTPEPMKESVPALQAEAPEAEPEEEAEEPVKGRKPVPHVLRTSMYFDREVHDALREIAFRERLNVSDLVNEGLDAVFKARGYPSVAKLKDRGAKRRKGDRKP